MQTITEFTSIGEIYKYVLYLLYVSYYYYKYLLVTSVTKQNIGLWCVKRTVTDHHIVKTFLNNNEQKI